MEFCYLISVLPTKGIFLTGNKFLVTKCELESIFLFITEIRTLDWVWSLMDTSNNKGPVNTEPAFSNLIAQALLYK